mgnify:FL=1
MMKHATQALLAGLLVLGAGQATALTLKTGQVLGSDGEVYDGASPEQIERMIENAEREDWGGNKRTSGVIGKDRFIVVEEKPVFVPLNELRGKTKEAIREIVKQNVVESLTEDLAASLADEMGGFDAAELAENLERLDLENDEVVQGLADTAAAAAEHSEKALEQAQQVISDSLALAEKTMSDPAFESQLEQNIEQLHQTMCAGKEGSGADSGVSDGAGGTMGC